MAAISKWRRIGYLCVLAPFLLAGCASVPVYRATVSPGTGGLTIVASDFHFDPNTITVSSTGRVRVTVKNVSRSPHTLTVKDPTGKVISYTYVPPGKSASTDIEFATPGVYRFFCSIPFHADFGMRGSFTVS